MLITIVCMYDTLVHTECLTNTECGVAVSIITPSNCLLAIRILHLSISACTPRCGVYCFLLKVLLNVIDGICIDDFTAETGYKYLTDRYVYYYALSKWATYVIFPLCVLIVSFLEVYASKM